MEFKAVNDKTKTISVKSESKIAGRIAMKYSGLSLEHYWVLIEKFQASFGIKKINCNHVQAWIRINWKR